ncbi:MAG TPA: cation:proton antiporter, partial [Streptosporangiaceae bacterium]|nr:cation:proton antiporter [Streptosporangiaceae bacterium]
MAGLMVGHDTPRFTSGASRLQATAVWRLADFLLQGFVFLLIGQQIGPVVRGLRAYPASTVAVTVGVVLLPRPLWLVLTQHLPRAPHTRLGGTRRRSGDAGGALSAREITVLSWAGTRGVISLAAIFTLPLTSGGGRPFPGRDLLLFSWSSGCSASSRTTTNPTCPRSAPPGTRPCCGPAGRSSTPSGRSCCAG